MVHRIRALIGMVLEPRRSPNMRLRASWWLAVFALLGLGWALPVTREAVSFAWTTVNVLYVLAAIGWSCFHPRSLLGGREVSLRWSVLLTFLAALILFSQLYSLLEQIRPTTEGPNHIAAVLVVVTVIICPVLFALILGLGILGGMVGAFAMRHCSDVRQATRSAIVFWFSAFMALAVWASASQHHSDLRLLYGVSIPLLTVAFCRLADGPDAPLRHAGHMLVQRVEKVLILRNLRRGRWRTLDLRGAALGLLAAAMMLGAPTVLITPLKTLALVTLMQVRAASIPHVHLGFDQALGTLMHRNDIVILTLDPAMRYRILHDSSEAAVQAEMIKKLRHWGVTSIVVPTPLVHPGQYEPTTDQPAPNEAAVKRCRRDIPLLARAIEGGQNVLVTLPPAHETLRISGSDYAAISDPVLQPLYSHAVIARADLPLSEVVHLPIIPNKIKHKEYILAPVRLSMNLRKATVAPNYDKDDQAELAMFAGAGLPQITPEGVLVNFLGQGPRYDFTQISYATLLHGEMIHVTPSDVQERLNEGHWEKPEQFFKHGQVVLLDSVLHPLKMTPLGVISQSDLLAYATATLLSGQSIRPVRAASLVVVTLFMGLAIGGACFRRDPLDALWRATIPLFLVALVSLLLFVIGGIWLDPMLPLGTSMIALTMVTQLSFAQERSERRRTRALFQRFVASDQMDNWLAMPEDALALGGKRQTVCVLFADVRNFTQFAEQNEADKVIEVINAYMSGLTEALHRHGGVLDKYTGDGLMAWFPVKENQYADLKNAIDAALAMRDAALAISTQMPPEEQLDIGIGLHYGDAVVGLVGSEKLQINWTALGHTVVVSARLQTIAAGGEVVISESLHEATCGAFAVVEGVPVMVKGLSIPVRPYRVIAAAPESDQAVVPMPRPIRTLPAPPPDSLVTEEGE